MSNDIKNLLVEGKTKLGIWGCGYIGFTDLIYFANEGVYTIGYDTDKKVVDAIKRGEIIIPNLSYWLGFPIKPFAQNKMISSTGNWRDMLDKDIRAHIIAIPTEKNGEPWGAPLEDVVSKISKRNPTPENPDLVIVESTLTPGMFDGIIVKTFEDDGWTIGREFLIGVAPRRDWFDSPEKNLKTLARVIGGTTKETNEVMRGVLEIVSDNLITATDHRIAEMVKSVENSILHLCAVYASQLARAYPDIDVNEVLRLASTHWRIPYYYPSVGTGGYCIPVSSKYVREGATKEEFLKLLDDTLEFDQNQPHFVADVIAEKVNGKVGILGLTYKGDLKVHTLSPSLRIVDRLKERGLEVYLHDPYYSAEEIKSIVGVDTFTYPEDISKFEGLIIVPTHRVYTQTPKNILFSTLRKGQVILDNEGVWERWRNDFKKKGIDYHRIGDKNWYIV